MQRLSESVMILIPLSLVALTAVAFGSSSPALPNNGHQRDGSCFTFQIPYSGEVRTRLIRTLLSQGFARTVPDSDSYLGKNGALVTLVRLNPRRPEVSTVWTMSSADILQVTVCTEVYRVSLGPTH